MLQTEAQIQSDHFSVDLAAAKSNAENALQRAVVDGALRNGPGDDSADAALLQLALVRYPDRALCETIVTTIWNDLKLNDTLAG